MARKKLGLHHGRGSIAPFVRAGIVGKGKREDRCRGESVENIILGGCRKESWAGLSRRRRRMIERGMKKLQRKRRRLQKGMWWNQPGKTKTDDS